MSVKTSVVACPLHHLLVDGAVADLQVAVQRTHEAVVVSTGLINTYLRDRLEAHDAGTLDRAGVLAAIERSFTQPWVQYRSVRYTNAQRRFELKTIVAQKKLEALRRKNSIDDLESDLARHTKRAPTLAAFTEYLQEHFRTLRTRLDFYSSLSLRRRRWRSYVLGQKSIARLKNRVREMAPSGAPVAIAWGAWGLVSGAACSRGNPPALGIGLMKEFAKDFLVVPTPEHHTSGTCSICLRSGRGPQDASPCAVMETARSTRIRGLRFCQTCSSHLNRDQNASLNIAMNFRLYMSQNSGIRALTAQERELITADAGS